MSERLFGRPLVKEAGRTYIGIDPGARGGIAWITDGRIRAVPMPTSRADLWSAIRTLAAPRMDGIPSARPLAAVELVGGYIAGAAGPSSSEEDRDGTGGQAKGGGAANGSRMFAFGRQYGEVLMALCAASIPCRAVAPRAWQSYLSQKKKRGTSRREFKAQLVRAAQERYQSLRITASTADAVLIVTWLYLTSTTPGAAHV